MLIQSLVTLHQDHIVAGVSVDQVQARTADQLIVTGTTA